jgi:hypothetical protein
MATTKFYKQIKAHHFKSDGTPRFKHYFDNEKGKWVADPSTAHLLDYEIISKTVPDTFWQSFWKGFKSSFFTIFKVILVIAAYGAVRGHLEEKKKK